MYTHLAVPDLTFFLSSSYRDELTVKEVCKKLGHPLLIADTEDNLRRYKEKVTKSMTKEQIAYIDFTKTVYPAAAFFLAAHKNKVKVTQAAIGNSLDIQKPELQRAIASFQVMLEPPTSATPAGAAQQKPIVLGASGGVKRTRTDEEKKSSDITTPVIIPNEQKQQQSTDNNNNCDCDDGYMAFRKVAEDLGLHKCCDDDSKEKQQAPPPTKKHKKLVQTTLKF